MKTTTDLKILQAQREDGFAGTDVAFTWGIPVKWHQIGTYTVLDYNCKIGNTQKFHAWVGGMDTQHSYLSLDAAIVGAIAYRVEGPNSKAAGYFMRMIGQGDQE